MRREFTLSGLGLGIFFVVLGLAFFSDSSSGTSYFAIVFRFYPILAILLGLDYVLNSFNQSGTIKRPEGWVATLIIIITLCGLTITTVPKLLGNSWEKIADFDLSWISSGSWNDELQSEKTLKQEFQLPAGTTTLQVENEFGNLQVRPGTGNSVTATADLKIYGTLRRKTKTAEAEAEAEAVPDVKLSGEASGGRFLVKLVKPELRRGRVQANITITVPPKFAVELTNSFGEIYVEEVQGNLQVENRHGEIEIGRVAGDATVNNQFANVTIGTIDGNLDIHVSNGKIEIDQVGKNLTARSEFGGLEADSVLGDLQAKCKNGGVEIGKVMGKTKVENAFAGVTLRDCRGPVQAEVDYGNLDVELTQLTGSYDFDVQFANVNVTLPSNAKYTLDAATSFGKINGPIQATTTGNTESFNGQINGGGPLIKIRNKNGNITIE
jgi:hypothetical protein